LFSTLFNMNNKVDMPHFTKFLSQILVIIGMHDFTFDFMVIR
jgi:hypothetical protein